MPLPIALETPFFMWFAIFPIGFNREGTEEFYWDHFAPSVPMSTYLVAFIVANFTQVAADVGNANWKFNIYARPSARNQAQSVYFYSFDIAIPK